MKKTIRPTSGSTPEPKKRPTSTPASSRARPSEHEITPALMFTGDRHGKAAEATFRMARIEIAALEAPYERR